MKIKNPFKREKRDAETSLKDKQYLTRISFGNRDYYPQAIANPTVESSINLIANTFSVMDIKLYFKKNDGSFIPATFHPLYNVLYQNPNDEESIDTWKNRAIRYQLKNGDDYLLIDKNKLYHLDPAYMVITREAGRKVYTYLGERIPTNSILQIPALNYDGTNGISPFKSASYAVSLGNQLDAYAGNSIANGFNSGAKVKPTLDYFTDVTDAQSVTEQVNQLSAYYANNYSGAVNSGKPIIELPNTDISRIDLSSNKDAQLAESRNFQVQEIAKLLNIPLSLLGDMRLDNLESATETFLTFCLLPWIENFESYLNLLLTDYERERYFFKFDTSQLLKVATQARIDALTKQVSYGLLTPNEARAKEGMTAIEGDFGDIHFFPANLIPGTDENIAAYFAQSKLALSQTHNQSGDDKK